MASRIDLTGPIEFKPENRKLKPIRERSMIVRLRGSHRRTEVAFGRATSSSRRFDSQRVMVKARFVKGRRSGSAEGLRKHLSYLERSGVGIDGKKAEFLNRDGAADSRDVRQQVTLWANDHHHFRFIVSPERSEGVHLESFARDLVARMEEHLGTKLEWFAAAHYNTDNPHIHLLIRGKDEKGHDLILEREFIKDGARRLAEELLTLELGPRTIEDRNRELEKSIVARHFTGIDRSIVQDLKDGAYSPRLPQKGEREWEQEGRRRSISRLQFLGTLGLAKEASGGKWVVSESLEADLRALAHRIEVQKRLSEHLKERIIGCEVLIIDEPRDLSKPTEGKVLARGISNELTDTVFLAVEDGRNRIYYAELGEYSESKGFESKLGSIVKLQFPQHGRADDLILSYANERGGILNFYEFSESIRQEVNDGKRRLPGGVSVDDYLKSYAERLSNLTSLGLIHATKERSWQIPENLKMIVDAHERKIGRKRSIQVNTLSYLTLEEQISAPGATWLDRVLSSQGGSEHGPEIKGALAHRQSALEERGIQINKHLTRKLYAYELSQVEGQLTAALGPVQRVGPGTTARGEIVDYRLLSNGYHAVIKREVGYSIVPMPYRASKIEKGTQVEFGIESGSDWKGHFLRVFSGRAVERGA